MCFEWRAVFGISAMVCWVTLLTSNPGPMTVTANFPRFCGLLWSFVAGKCSPCWIYINLSTWHDATERAYTAPCCDWLGPIFNLQKAALTWVHLGPTSAQRVQLAPTGAWVTSSMAQLGPQWGPCMSVWGQVGPKLGPTRANNADSIQNPENDFSVAISNVCFLWHTHAHTLKFRHVRPNVHQNMPKLRRLGPKGGSSWSQVVQIGLGLSRPLLSLHPQLPYSGLLPIISWGCGQCPSRSD